MNQAHQGEKALAANDLPTAIDLYTTAITASPSTPSYYIQRSIAYTRSSSHAAALEDANSAVILATTRAKRELIALAQLRRGIALFHLERYGDADFVLAIAKGLNRDFKEMKSLPIWQAKVCTNLKAVAADEPYHKKAVTVKELPTASVPAQASQKDSTSLPATQVKPIAQTPAEKIRHDWYQSGERVYVTLLAKGVPKGKTVVNLDDHSVAISFPLVSGADYDFSLDPLFAAIDASQSSVSVMSTKVELSLKKQIPSQKWPSLEALGNVLATAPATTSVADPIANSQQKVPAYPTSSKSGPKDWDKIMGSFKKPANNEDEVPDSSASTDDTAHKPGKADEQLYVDSDEEGGDAVNSMFRKIYKGADDDTRRAMMKSFSESGGTALSTDWSDVKKKRSKSHHPTAWRPAIGSTKEADQID